MRHATLLVGAAAAAVLVVVLARRDAFAAARQGLPGPDYVPPLPWGNGGGGGEMQPAPVRPLAHLVQLEARERELWDRERALREEADRVARAYGPVWQAAVGRLQSQANEIHQQRGRLSYEIMRAKGLAN